VKKQRTEVMPMFRASCNGRDMVSRVARHAVSVRAGWCPLQNGSGFSATTASVRAVRLRRSSPARVRVRHARSAKIARQAWRAVSPLFCAAVRARQVIRHAVMNAGAPGGGAGNAHALVPTAVRPRHRRAVEATSALQDSTVAPCACYRGCVRIPRYTDRRMRRAGFVAVPRHSPPVVGEGHTQVTAGKESAR